MNVESKRLRVAFVGLGDVAQVHLSAYEGESWIEISAACDLDPARVDAFAAQTGARGFTNLQVMLDAGGFDLVLLLTPAVTHRALCEQIASAGFHLLCEKPIALSRSEALAMAEACDRNGVHLFYGSCYRYLPAVARAREMIQAGAIGRVRLLTEQLVGGFGPENYHDYGASHYPPGTPGGPGLGLIDHGIHLIDVLPWLCGSKVTGVSGSGVLSGEGPGVEYIHMTLECGARAHLLYYSASWFTHLPGEAHLSAGAAYAADGSVLPPGSEDPHPGCIHVYGDRGALRIFHYANALYQVDGDGLREVDLHGRPAPGHFASQLEACANTLFSGTAPKVTAEDGQRALDTALRAYGL